MISLYIHIPFCIKKCLYCGFFSTVYTHDQAERFLEGLHCEAGQRSKVIRSRQVKSLYFGGGTPTILTREHLNTIFEIVSENFSLLPDAEITVEANPNSMSDEVLGLLRNRGVNRLSVGVQSLCNDMLKILGRTHTAQEAEDSVRRARSAGFQNISIDLMYGIPGQDVSRWRESILRALALDPDHLSVYSLSLDKGSAYARMEQQGNLNLPDEDLVAGMFEYAVETLSAEGYQQYELSNFARPGFECWHNSNYWDGGEYLGIGPAAWSYLSHKRSCNIADVSAYGLRLREGVSVTVFEEILSGEESERERLLLGLRTAKGVNLYQFRQDYGENAYQGFITNVERARQAGLVRFSDGYVVLTNHGQLLADEVILMLSR